MRAIITGANRGLGFETAKELGRKGYEIILCARDVEKAKKAARELESIGAKITPIALDVGSDASVEKFADFLQREVKEVHVLVNNAGVYLDPKNNECLKTPVEIIEQTFNTNAIGAYRMAQLIVPYMKNQKFGRIVNVSSGMGQLSEMDKGFPAYRMSKTALNALTKMLSAELSGSDILVNSVCPGWVKTDMGGPNAERSLEQGVYGIVWAATLPKGGPSGGFFRDGKALPW